MPQVPRQSRQASHQSLLMLQAIEDLPGEESPEVFGLHANADLTFRTLQARDRLQLFRDTRPAQMSRKAGASREDVVDKLAEDLLVKVSFGSQPLRVTASAGQLV